MRIAILAFQGAFAEHQQMLSTLGIESFLVRNANDWKQPKDGLIIPGGESTTMMRIINDEHIAEVLCNDIKNGLPVFGTCAGLILLDKLHLNLMNMEAKRNAYGRQLGSFRIVAPFKTIGEVPMTFIRAPYIASVGDEIEVLAVVDEHIVAAKQQNMLVTAFHPELDDDDRIHRFFLEMCEKYAKK